MPAVCVTLSTTRCASLLSSSSRNVPASIQSTSSTAELLGLFFMPSRLIASQCAPGGMVYREHMAACVLEFKSGSIERVELLSLSSAHLQHPPSPYGRR
jgi:hypothetical protein